MPGDRVVERWEFCAAATETERARRSEPRDLMRDLRESVERAAIERAAKPPSGVRS